MINQHIKINNPNYKIGIKELTIQQLRAGFPNYEQLLNKILEIREESKKVDKAQLENNPFETLKYDNIFSILGGRGAGKTSVLFTMYKKFMENENNIMVPIVMPELLDNNESIISWILSAIEECLNGIEHKIQNVFDKCTDSTSYKKMCNDYDFFDRCVFNKNNKLRKKFNELKQVFYYNENKNFDSDYSENTELMAKSIQSGFEIIPKFVSFWNTLIAVYEQYLIAINYCDKTPLVFLFVDDADLKPEIINELLFIIPKFLSHPNVVVCISGSQKILALAVKYHMFKSITQSPYDLMALMDIENKYNGNSYAIENRLNQNDYSDDYISHIKFSELRYGKEYSKIDQLSDEVLRKLFPVYNRFYIQKYDNYIKKQSFQVFKDDSSDCVDSISISEKITILLEEYYTSVIEMHLNHKNSMRIQGKNEPSQTTIHEKNKYLMFLKKDYHNETHRMEKSIYMSFLGEYARDISAVYFALKELLDSLKEILEKLYLGEYGVADNRVPSECIEETYSVVIKFLQCAVYSNKHFKMFNRSLERLIKTRLLHWQIYIDYAIVLEFYKKQEYKSYNSKHPEPFIEMISLLNFIERLIVLMMPQRRNTHGIEELHEFLNDVGIKVVPHSEKIDETLYHYYVFHSLNLIPGFDIDKIEHQNSFINGVSRLKTLDIVKNNTLANQEWISLLAKVFYKRYSPFARLSYYSKELFIFENNKFLDNSYYNVKKDYHQYLFDELTKMKISSIVITKKETTNQQKEVLSFIKECLSNLKEAMLSLRFRINPISEEITDHLKHLDYVDAKGVKREIYLLIKLLRKSSLARAELIDRLNKIQMLIEIEEDYYLTLMLWFDDFKSILENNVKIEKNRSYSTYLEIIKNNYQVYIDYYVSLIKNKIEVENQNLPLKLNDKTVSSLISSEIKSLESLEWKKYIETK